MEEKSNKYSRLELHELQTIFMMRREKKKMQEIADILNACLPKKKRSKGTISKAYNLYKHPCGSTWITMTALEKAKYVHDQMSCNKKNKKTFSGQLKDAETREYVYDCMVNKHMSPEMISGTIESALGGKKISFKTIYNYTKKSDPELKKHLYEKGKKRRQNVMGRRSKIQEGAPVKTSIHEREESVNMRQGLYDWEGDTIVSCRSGKGGILSLVNRKTREKFFRHLPNLRAKTVYNFFLAFLREHPEVETITLDNGSEFSFTELIKLEKRFKLKIYYCDAYKSQQKGSVERSNRDFRKFYAKGTDFANVTQADVIRVQNILNSMPLKIHGFLSPEQMKSKLLAVANEKRLLELVA